LVNSCMKMCYTSTFVDILTCSLITRIMRARRDISIFIWRHIAP
jgi:hypothetical protein